MGDRDDIRQVIERAYIEGIHRDQDDEKVDAGFHSKFRMLVRQGAEIAKVDPGTFLAKVKERRVSDPAFFEGEFTYDFPLIDVEGEAAVARIELFRGEKHLFTDYQLLYKFDDGWKIVSKIYQPHQ